MTTASTTKPSLQWKRGRTLEGQHGKFREWESRCGLYLVRESKPKGYARKFYALRWCLRRETWVSVEYNPRGLPRLFVEKHRAVAACKNHHRRAP